ncbi:hypothetical protein G7009_01950 [Pseudomonas capeferrum]|uniref:hypothetical protein n=1 Tax=Pseudomonas capeferrum TaxID=1495066 RepID=UPI0015E2C5D8|nr:hypothetical protein [Pseudomonas capeferrum]MBA1200563.1 hypothetical protein [Pseudomonas capeferrum]
MPADSRRMQDLQDDLKRTASELASISRALHAHARYLQHSVHDADPEVITSQVTGPRATASELREIAEIILP